MFPLIQPLTKQSSIFLTALLLIAAGQAGASQTLSATDLWSELQPIAPKSLSVQETPAPGTNNADAEPKPVGATVQAPATPAPTQFKYVSLSPVYFHHDKDTLTEQGQLSLEAAVAYIHKHDTISRIIIEGNTDYVGPQNYNYKLSDRRIRSVRAYLTAMGVDSTLITVQGRGETQPVDENWTRAGRERNRQVAIFAIHQASAH